MDAWSYTRNDAPQNLTPPQWNGFVGLLPDLAGLLSLVSFRGLLRLGVCGAMMARLSTELPSSVSVSDASSISTRCRRVRGVWMCSQGL